MERRNGRERCRATLKGLGRSALGGAMALLAMSAMAQGTIPAPPPAAAGRPVSVTVDLNKGVGEYKPIYSWFGADEANFTTMHDGKVLLRKLHDMSPVPVYIRVHHLLTSGNGVAELKWSSTNVYTEDANGKPVYDFHISGRHF